jgi:hypothetical protein
MGRMRGIIEEPTGLRYVPSLFSEDQGRDLLERVRGLEFDEVRMQAAKYCHGSARSNSDRPATLAKSADVAKRGRPSVGGPPTAPATRTLGEGPWTPSPKPRRAVADVPEPRAHQQTAPRHPWSLTPGEARRLGLSHMTRPVRCQNLGCL